MIESLTMPIFFLIFAVLLALPVFWPGVDLFASGLFYRAGDGFFLADYPLFVFLHGLAYDGARVLGAVFAAGAVLSYFLRKQNKIGLFLPAKAWLFLFLALLIAPGLVANVGFKDHWGRARPREMVEFGGAENFSPVLVPHFDKARSNGSFVSGDAAFGFFLPAFAYVVPRRYTRRVFWGTMVAGGVFGLTRLVMGAHFFSDIIYATFFMLVTVAAVHAAMYGRKETAARWRDFFRPSTNP